MGTEQEFGERLRRYRKDKGLTQQELADRVGVSNKTVSRWESGGGYPDVSMLVPLARALGVAVDDLLDPGRPVRTLTRTDWQGLLSFAFALGGGLLYFLLRLFAPAPVCYLIYLGCMAYGVYLQAHYARHSRWFRLANAAMDFAVSLSFVTTAGTAAAAWVGGLEAAALLLQTPVRLAAAGLAAALAALMTAAACLAVERWGFRTPRWRDACLRLERPGPRRLAPALCVLALPLFWAAYRLPLPPGCYLNQKAAYLGLLAALTALCLALSLKKGYRPMLCSAAVLAVVGLWLPALARQYAWLSISGRVAEAGPMLAERYPRFGALSAAQLAAALAGACVCLIPAVLRVGRRPEAPGVNSGQKTQAGA